MAKPLTILIAEDTKRIRTIMAFTLKQRGYDVVECEDGAGVMSAVRETRPDLLVLDVMMPNKSGFEVLEELRADSDLKSTPVLVSSAVASGTGQDDELLRIKAGSAGYLSKPFQIQRFVEEVERILFRAEES